MRRYIILSNRKRAIIALAHTVAFLLLAVFTSLLLVRPLHSGSPRAGWIIAGIYVAVTSALLVLAAVSGNLVERIYFGLCATSAAFGLARQILGDTGIPSAVFVRVAMLAAAVAVGVKILREHRAERASPDRSPAD